MRRMGRLSAFAAYPPIQKAVSSLVYFFVKTATVKNMPACTTELIDSVGSCKSGALEGETRGWEA